LNTCSTLRDDKLYVAFVAEFRAANRTDQRHLLRQLRATHPAVKRRAHHHVPD
jgi:hypothetical protein